MKKLLALVLALVMSMSLVTISNAAFKDADTIDNKEAVDVMNAIGVLIGDEKGNFNAKGELTRAQACKIIAYLDLGGKTADAIKGTGTVFTDVKATSWYAGYVEYCAGAGYVAGVGGGKFDPEAKVTGVQFAKMLLCALGYKAEVEGYTGTDYTIAVARDANKNDLFDGLSIVTSANLTREQAAQMAFNALEATVVEYQGGTNVTTSDGTSVIVNAVRNEVKRTSGKDYRNGETENVNGTQQLCEKLYDNDLRKNEDTTDDFGRPASEWTYHTTSIKCADEPTLTYTKDVKVKDIYADLGKPSNAFVEDTSAKDGVDGKIVIDGRQGQQDNSTADITVLKDNGHKVGAKGATTEVYYDKNSGEVNIIVINTYLAQATEDYDKDDDELTIEVKSTKNFETTLDGDDFVLNGYKKDDYILVNAITSNGTDYTVKEIAPATVVSDVKVSAYKADDSVTAGGTKYSYNATALQTGALGKDLIGGTYTLQDTTYDLYLDANGYVIGVEAHSDEANLTDYLFVTDAAHPGFDYQAKVQFMDGTTKTITVKKTAKADGTMTKVDDATGTTVADGKLVKNQYCTFTVNKNGEYELTYVAAARQKNGTAIDTDQKANVVTGVDKPANAKTVFIADEKVYTGVKNAPDASGKTVYVLLDKDSKYILAAYTEAKGTNSSSASEYVYITNSTVTTAKDEDDNTYYIFEAVIDGKKVSDGLKVSSDTHSNVVLDENNKATAGLYEITGYTDGYADISTVKTADVANELTYLAGAKKVETKEGVLTITKSDNSETSVVLNDKVVIYSVDATDSYTTKTVSESGVNSLKGDTFTLYLIQASKSDDTIVTAYIVRTH